MNITAIIAGAGRMGRRHVEIVRRTGLELIGLADRSSEALALARREQDLSGVVTAAELGELLAQRVPDCVIVSTTADSHCELVCLAARSGVRFILVEKPLAISLAQCEEMIATCAAHGARLAVNHQMRFMELYARPRELLASPAYGGFTSMTVVAGNIGAAMNGSHYLEAFRFISGEEPHEVTAWFSPEVVSNPRGPQFVDRGGTIRVTTRSGKRLYLEISPDQGHGLHVIYAGRNGTISVDELAGEMSTDCREEAGRDQPTTRYGMPAERGRIKLAPAEIIGPASAVLRALLHDENSVTAETGALAVRTLVAAHLSAESGSRPVLVQGPLDRERRFPWA